MSLELDDAAREHQPPGGGVDEHALRVAEVALPVAACDLLGDEFVGRSRRRGMRSKGLGEAHQDDALVAREAVLAHEGIDARVVGLACAHGMDEAAGDVGGAAALLLGIDGALDQAADEARLVDEVMRGDLVARGLIARFGDFLLFSAQPFGPHASSRGRTSDSPDRMHCIR